MAYWVKHGCTSIYTGRKWIKCRYVNIASLTHWTKSIEIILPFSLHFIKLMKIKIKNKYVNNRICLYSCAKNWCIVRLIFNAILQLKHNSYRKWKRPIINNVLWKIENYKTILYSLFHSHIAIALLIFPFFI